MLQIKNCINGYTQRHKIQDHFMAQLKFTNLNKEKE